MAEFEKKHHGSSEFNQGNKYVANDGVQPATINNAVENSLYDYAFIQALTETPDVSEANSTGTPSVTLIDNPGNAQGISGAKKFKFSHLKGATGATPNFSIGAIIAGTSSTDASVTITGTAENPVLNFTVPRGRSISSITAGTPTSTNTQTTTPITVNYDDGTNSSFNVVSARGLKGDPVWVRYATNNAGSGMTATPSSSTKYIGFYVGSTASTTASDYTWSKYVGKEPAAISIGVSDDAVPSPEVTVEWDDGSSPTVVPVDTSDCHPTEPVNGIVTSVNGKDGAVELEIVNLANALFLPSEQIAEGARITIPANATDVTVTLPNGGGASTPERMTGIYAFWGSHGTFSNLSGTDSYFLIFMTGAPCCYRTCNVNSPDIQQNGYIKFDGVDTITIHLNTATNVTTYLSPFWFYIGTANKYIT